VKFSTVKPDSRNINDTNLMGGIIQNSTINNAYGVLWVSNKKKYNKPISMLNLKTIVLPSDNRRGVPQEGAISPLLMNWALDGLSTCARAHSIGSGGGVIQNNFTSGEKRL